MRLCELVGEGKPHDAARIKKSFRINRIRREKARLADYRARSRANATSPVPYPLYTKSRRLASVSRFRPALGAWSTCSIA